MTSFNDFLSLDAKPLNNSSFPLLPLSFYPLSPPSSSRPKRCGKMFHLASCELLRCERGPLMIGPRGEVSARHKARADWSLTDCVGRLHKLGAWEDIYWLLW